MGNVHVSILSGPIVDSAPPFPSEGAGAVVCFEGRVRGLEEGRAIHGLCYEAYEPMAADMLLLIGEETVGRYGLVGLSVEHSRGMVMVGECSFRLRIAGRHRRE